MDTLLTKFNNDVGINKNYKLWSSDIVKQLLNQAYFQVQKDGNFNWSDNETSAVLSFSGNEATLPSDFIVLNLVKAGNTTLDRTDKLELVANNADLTKSGSPSQYYMYGGSLGTDKVPTNTVTLYYKKQLPDMDTTTPVDSVFPSRFDLAIVKYAAYLAFSTYLPNDARGDIRLRDYEMQVDSIFNYQLDDSNVTFSYEK